METTDSFDGLPRVTYRLDAGELDHLRAALARGGLAGATLTPRGAPAPTATDGPGPVASAGDRGNAHEPPHPGVRGAQA